MPRKKDVSPIDPYIEDVRDYVERGFTHGEIAFKLQSTYGVETSSSSVRRALKRHHIGREYDRFNEMWGEDENADENYYDETPWGLGRAKPVEPSTTEATEVVVFGSDFHYPYHDPVLVDDFITLIERIQPHRVVLNGDMNDYFQLSHFNISKQRLDDLQFEIDGGNEIRRRVRAAAPNAVIDENEGNHDERIRTYVWNNARALSSLRALDPQFLFQHKDYEINYHMSGAGFLLRPEFLVKHGTIVRGEAGATAKGELQLAGISGISGHVHRLQTYRRTGYSFRQWTEQGCLCRLDADYIKHGMPNWQPGCVIGEFSTRSNAFSTTEVSAGFDGRLKMNFLALESYV